MITAIILAGGKSSRMGRDKGLINYKGKAMIQWVIEAVMPLVQELIIVSNNKDYEQFGIPVFPDDIKDRGPLSGLCTGLSKTSNARNIVLSCDGPNITTEMIEILVGHSTNQLACIARHNEYLEPLLGVYDTSCLKSLNNQLTKNELALNKAVMKLIPMIVDFGPEYERNFKNFNSPTDLKL